MSKHGRRHDIRHTQELNPKRHQASVELQEITPGRAPAEGPDIDMASPSHERFEQHTAERDPAEG